MYSEPKHVLVVEDSDDLNRLYTKYLKKSGFHVNSEFSVAGAYEYLQGNKPDVIVMDLDLGDGNGQDIMDMLQREGKLADIKIVVVSGTLYISERNVRVDRANYALLKPVSPRELVTLVRTLWN